MPNSEHKKHRGDSVDGNTRTLSRSRHRNICFTLHNWTKEELTQLLEYFDKNSYEYIIGEELGKSGETPHLQGAVKFNNAIKFSTLKNLINRIHIENMKSSMSKNIEYCSKESINIYYKGKNTQLINKLNLLKLYNNINWYDWQKNILDICNGPKNDRIINWIYDGTGCKGKSFLCKYISLKYNCIIADGKKNDVFNQIKIECIDNKKNIDIVLLDIPRHNIDCLNYGMIEQIKNGLIYSGKYEGGLIYLNNVHLFIFSNYMPDLDKFTKDRWNIICL